MKKVKVAFVCVHNSCRSQIAEALLKYYGEGFFEVYSGGTEVVDRINQDAVRIMKARFGIDMEKSQYSKLVTKLPEVDYLITMGCNVVCPFLPYKYETEDWGLDDPTGKDDEEFNKTIDEIEEKVKNLIKRLQ